MGIYIIINGLLTFDSDSVVLQNLYSLVGFLAFTAPFFQVAAGVMILLGICRRMANLEAGGLVMIMFVSALRGIALFLEPHYDPKVLNSITIVVLLALACLVRLNHILVVNKVLEQKKAPKP